jgi:hypothetical protein
VLEFATTARFDVVDFHPVDTGGGYRSLTLRRPQTQWLLPPRSTKSDDLGLLATGLGG